MYRGRAALLVASAVTLGALGGCRPLVYVSQVEAPAVPPSVALQGEVPPASTGQDGQAPILGKPRSPTPARPPMALPPLPFPPPGWALPPSAATPTPGPGLRQTLTDLAYGDDARQRLDLYVPASVEPVPVLLFVHGGAWSSGDKSQYAWLGVQLAQQGLLVAVTNYRLSPAVQHPQHAQDVAAATAWLYRHAAEYGGDPQRLYLAGHSAGAHLVSLVALDARYLAAEGISEPIVAGVAAFAGAAYDLDARYAATPLAPLLAPAFGSDPARWAEAAPLRYVKPGAPPFLLVHGLLDAQAPATSAQTFATALQQQGVPTTLYLLPQLDHFTALLTGLAALPTFVRAPDGKPTDARRPRPGEQARPARGPSV
ncbi:MAG TPA: alpha/beta hydrolase [Chloroflexota bacterium]|jgi:acetyl esterase/lipase|nr:alpha/beta hydrolase [Chloroflexota bacterium]